MGLTTSRMEAAAASTALGAEDAAAEAAAQAAKSNTPETGRVNFDLPCPVKYEEMQREVMMSLKTDLFEGARFDYNKQLNQKFSSVTVSSSVTWRCRRRVGRLLRFRRPASRVGRQRGGPKLHARGENFDGWQSER